MRIKYSSLPHTGNPTQPTTTETETDLIVEVLSTGMVDQFDVL